MIDRPLYVDKIMAYVDTPFVKILTGVRRCGKSTILKMIMERLKTERNIPEDRIISCRFDSMEYEDMTAKQIYTLLKEKLSPAGKTYLFLDEVQEIKGWEKIVNSLASDFDVDLYITGSNSRMMSSEIATYLTGRYVSFRIFTLSFGEYLMFKSKFANVGEPKTELANYVRLGGFATHLQAYSQDEIYTIVRDIYNSTIFSDIVKRNQVRKIDQLERVVKYTFSNVGNTFSAKSIADYLKSERRSLDNETVYSYLDKLEKAYLLHRCSRYDLQGKEILKTQEKFYLADVALRYSVLGYNAWKISCTWNFADGDIQSMWGKPVMVRLILWQSDKTKKFMFRLRRKSTQKRQKSENITACLKYPTIIPNLFSQQTNLPVGTMRESRQCT